MYIIYYILTEVKSYKNKLGRIQNFENYDIVYVFTYIPGW